MAYDPYSDNANKGKGAGFLTFDWDKTGKKPKFLKIKEDKDISLDIVPYRIASKNHPAVAAGKADIGEEAYSFDFFVHRNVGPGGKYNIICPQETYGRRCPICEQRAAIGREYGFKSKEYAGTSYPQHRIIYNVVDPDDPKEEIMIFEENFNKFEQPLLIYSAGMAKRQGKNYLRYGDLSEGYTIFGTVTMASFKDGEGKGGNFATYTFTGLEKRAKPHDLSLIDKAIPFDKYVILRSEEDILHILSGAAEVEEEPEPEPVQPTYVAAKPEVAKEKAPPPKVEAPVVKDECPVDGGSFGVDYGEFGKVCARCQLYTKCKAAHEK